MSKSRASQSGLTLIEVIASMLILASSVVAGLELFSLQQEVHAAGVSRSRANMFASREIELMRSEEFQNLENTQYEVLAEDAAFDLARTVTEVTPGLKQVQVRVRWHTPRGGRQMVSHLTYIIRR